MRRRKAPQTKEKIITVGDQNIRLFEDGSEYLGWSLRTAHADSTGMVFQRFSAKLRTASEEEADVVISTLFAKNRKAVLFGALLQVAAERPEVFAKKLWGFASAEPVLLSGALRTDAIAAVAAFYSQQPEDAKRSFELAAFDFGTDDEFHQMERSTWLARLFQAIGQDQLVTEEARSFLLSDEGSRPVSNEPYFPTATVSAVTQRQLLQEAGVSFEEADNDVLQTLTEQVKKDLGMFQAGASAIENVPLALHKLEELGAAIRVAETASTDNGVICNAEDMAGDIAVAILRTDEGTKSGFSPADIEVLQRVAITLSRSERTQYGRAPRNAVIPALFALTRYPAAAENALERLGSLASDQDLSVRFQIAQNLASLEESAPKQMWVIAEQLCSGEQSEAVLQAFVSQFLGRFIHRDTVRAETMLLSIHKRFPFERTNKRKREGENLDQAMAQVFAALYVRQDREACRKEVFRWTATPLEHHEQIRSGLFAVRDATCAGYDNEDPDAREPRNRVHALLKAVIDSTTTGIEAHYKLNHPQQVAAVESAKTLAECLHYASSTLYFGSGAFKEQNMPSASAIKTVHGKSRFVSDVEPLLKRIGDVPVPQTTYQLVQILEFLLPGNPAACFGLFADVMTVNGRRQGFQLESLGVDAMVRLVSQCLADHEDIFRDDGLRQLLVDCIDLFVEAGWPAAVRLAYRVPDALR